MNRKEILDKMKELFTTVHVSFHTIPDETNPSPLYTYLAPYSMNLKSGDLVCVLGGSRFSVGIVVKVDEHPIYDDEYVDVYKWVTGTIDTSEFEKIVDIEESIGSSENDHN